MSGKIKDLVENLKEPILIFDPFKSIHLTPNCLSHVGGYPYIEENIHYPICQCCKKPLDFVFQLSIPSLSKKTELFTFFYCFACNVLDGNKGFKMIRYENPSPEKMKKQVSLPKSFPTGDFVFSLEWSLPDWDTLNELFPDIYQKFVESNKEDAWNSYEVMREKLLSAHHYDQVSYYGGYPNFLNSPTFPKCSCCKKNMNLWMQFGSYSEFKIDWDDFGCLYIFKCKDHDQFSIEIQ